MFFHKYKTVILEFTVFYLQRRISDQNKRLSNLLLDIQEEELESD